MKILKPKLRTLRQNLVDEVIYGPQFLIFFVLTITIIITGSIFNIPGIVDHPQFGEAADPELLKSLMRKDFWLGFSYYGFFILDFFWAFFLLLIIWKFVSKQMSNHPKSYPKYLLYVFTTLVCLAFISDAFENLNYIFFVDHNSYLTNAKLLLYLLVGIIFFLSFLRYFVKELLGTFIKFLASSLYSLLILIVIGVFLPTASQVNSIVVDLYLEPWNLVILLLVAPIFAVVLAHYPSYFRIDGKQREWYMAKKFRFLFGIVHYRYDKDFPETEEGKTEGKVNFMFRILGICFYVALFYMIAYTSEINFEWLIQTSKLSLVLLLIGILLMYHLKQIKDRWYERTYKYFFNALPNFYDGDYSSLRTKTLGIRTNLFKQFKQSKISQEESIEARNIALRKINTPVFFYVGFLGFTILAHMVLFAILIFCKDCRYTEFTVLLSLLCIVLQTLTFVYYRVVRSVLKFTFFNDKVKSIMRSFIKEPYEKEPEDYSNEEKAKLKADKKLVDEFFKKHDFTGKSDFIKFLSKLRFGALSNNVNFLRINAIIGVVNAVFFLVINYNSDWSISFNSILIILSALFLYYGILVVLTKTYIYYKHSKEPYKKKNSIAFVYLSAILVTLLIIANILVKTFDNNLFTLFPIDRQATKELSLKTYVDNLDKDNTRYYIGCYGGGMKSNAWTLTVLNELYNRDKTFFSKSVGISGVSGGTMGLINMSAIIKYNRESTSWNSIISEISTENILSLDLTHILGRDTFNYLFVPFVNLSESDRSSRAMDRYAYLANGENNLKDKIAYRIYWRELYQEQDSAYPILISNTTNVRGNQGIAVSVKVENHYANSLLYQGADDILEIEPKHSDSKETELKYQTLGYYDAASTSNRFPMISPAAKIETKGHYNDGGIYENSGLLSAFKLFKAVNYLDTISQYKELRQKNVFISIVNDKNQYIRRVLKESLCTATSINRYSELSAMVSSIASTEMMPIFIKRELERISVDFSDKITFETIYLPHRFTVEDIKSEFGKELACARNSESIDEFLYKIVEKNNALITKLAVGNITGTKPIIEPPMSRVMAAPAYEFMVKMLEHPITKSALKSVTNQ